MHIRDTKEERKKRVAETLQCVIQENINGVRASRGHPERSQELAAQCTLSRPLYILYVAIQKRHTQKESSAVRAKREIYRYIAFPSPSIHEAVPHTAAHCDASASQPSTSTTPHLCLVLTPRAGVQQLGDHLDLILGSRRTQRRLAFLTNGKKPRA